MDGAAGQGHALEKLSARAVAAHRFVEAGPTARHLLERTGRETC